ncbi:phytanoyl-CoA dioxygenase family protein [Actinoplanes sp. URMC 104]|uniref:phytanoyl-CoA dioxygenase family protein n=1 Tax=Actinoplanes sp. URMC 104 TaxID=3423409 RepID=UPI003F19E225
MDSESIERFMADGFVKVERAVPPDVTAACAELLWEQIEAVPGDRSTWSRPVYRVGDMAQEPFRAAANTPMLHDAFDALAGPGRWKPRGSLGSFPLRFPHAEEPDDAGWHIEGSYQPPGESGYRVNVHSTGRALLMLFLFTDVGDRDAPTRIRVGSHMDVPAVLAPYGESGTPMMAVSAEVAAASEHRPVVFATGRAGDVFLCHPFLVHAAQPHHGEHPRFLAQPPLEPSDELWLGPYVLRVTDAGPPPIGATIRAALHGA